MSEVVVIDREDGPEYHMLDDGWPVVFIARFNYDKFTGVKAEQMMGFFHILELICNSLKALGFAVYYELDCKQVELFVRGFYRRPKDDKHDMLSVLIESIVKTFADKYKMESYFPLEWPDDESDVDDVAV